MTTEGDDGVHAAGGAKADLDLFNRPVYVACVDLAASEEFLELVKSALMAALEALSPGALFGLVSFAHKVGKHRKSRPRDAAAVVAGFHNHRSK